REVREARRRLGGRRSAHVHRRPHAVPRGVLQRARQRQSRRRSLHSGEVEHRHALVQAVSMDRRDFVRAGITLAAGAAAAPILQGCKLESRRDLADQQSIQLRDTYFRTQLERNPVTSTYLGGDGWDPRLQELGGRLRDYSEGALRDELRDYRQLE